jgi:hypothetical protein
MYYYMHVSYTSSTIPIVVIKIYDVYTYLFLLNLNFETIKIKINGFITFSKHHPKYHAKRVPSPVYNEKTVITRLHY